MSARTLTQLAVAVLGVVALALGAILVVREGDAARATPSVDAGSCDVETQPSPLSPASNDVVLLLSWEARVTLSLDGKKNVTSLPDDPQSFAAGTHDLVAECDGKQQRLTIDLLPFTPAAVHASCDAFFVVGARCDGCPAVDVQRRAAAKAGLDSPLFVAAAAQEKLELQEKKRAHGLLTTRWNALTERYSRVLQVVGREAPGAVASANERFEALSKGFANATTAGDVVGQDQSIRTAEETLKVFVHAARRARPDDCEFQKRLTNSF